MNEPSAGDPGALAARLAALPDEQLLAVLVVATAGRESLTPLYEAATRLLAESGRTPADLAAVIPDTAPPPGYRDAADSPASPQVDGGVGALAGDPSATPGGVSTYTGDGVPTYGSVRDRVERRIGTAFGARELDRQTPVGRGVEEQWEAREQAARERLEQIRTSLREGEGS